MQVQHGCLKINKLRKVGMAVASFHKARNKWGMVDEPATRGLLSLDYVVSNVDRDVLRTKLASTRRVVK